MPFVGDEHGLATRLFMSNPTNPRRLAFIRQGHNLPKLSERLWHWRTMRNEDANRFEVLILSHAGCSFRNKAKTVDPT